MYIYTQVTYNTFNIAICELFGHVPTRCNSSGRHFANKFSLGRPREQTFLRSVYTRGITLSKIQNCSANRTKSPWPTIIFRKQVFYVVWWLPTKISVKHFFFLLFISNAKVEDSVEQYFLPICFISNFYSCKTVCVFINILQIFNSVGHLYLYFLQLYYIARD